MGAISHSSALQCPIILIVNVHTKCMEIVWYQMVGIIHWTIQTLVKKTPDDYVSFQLSFLSLSTEK